MKIELEFIKEIYTYKEISSTNDIAIENHRKDEFTIFIAEKQSKGRGRNSRDWFSPSGLNLYFSFILKPGLDKKYFTSIPLFTAHSLYKTVKSYITNKNVCIKWPNDILVDKKKISGVLIEIKGDSVIVGVGINVNSETFPLFEKNSPTSFFLETGKYFSREKILREFFINFKQNYNLFKKEKKLTEELVKEINNVLFLKNSEVSVMFKNHEQKIGKIESVTPEGFLKLDKFIAVAGDVYKVGNNENG